jgi:hypothetical protein
MNSIVVTLVCPDHTQKERLHKIGLAVTTALRESLEELEGTGRISKGEVLLGKPGYGLVLHVKGSSNRPDL